MKETMYEYTIDVKRYKYLAEETCDILSGVVVEGVDPDDADEADNVWQLSSNLAYLELCELFTGPLQYGQVGHVGLGLDCAILGNTHTQREDENIYDDYV